jgi:hypothetical protein
MAAIVRTAVNVLRRQRWATRKLGIARSLTDRAGDAVENP